MEKKERRKGSKAQGRLKILEYENGKENTKNIIVGRNETAV
jgi:hypothetical protein